LFFTFPNILLNKNIFFDKIKKILVALPTFTSQYLIL
jgi:hypothetical protein